MTPVTHSTALHTLPAIAQGVNAATNNVTVSIDDRGLLAANLQPGMPP